MGTLMEEGNEQRLELGNQRQTIKKKKEKKKEERKKEKGLVAVVHAN